MQDQFKNYPKDYISNLKNAIKAAEKELENTPKCKCDGSCYPNGGYCETQLKYDGIVDGIISMSEEAGLI